MDDLSRALNNFGNRGYLGVKYLYTHIYVMLRMYVLLACPPVECNKCQNGTTTFAPLDICPPPPPPKKLINNHRGLII